jgi:uncharacterized membrane protein
LTSHFVVYRRPQVSNKSRSRHGKAAGAAPTITVREQKRAQFEGKRSSTRIYVIGAVVALAVVAAVAAYMISGGNGPEATASFTTTAPRGDVKIALADVSGGKAHFYSYDAGGTPVNYFVLKSSDGVVRAAFDACDVCFAQKKGYSQEGDEMVCNNCGRRFPSTRINVAEGGCNPSPLDRTEADGQLIISASDLQAGARYFQ